MDRSVSAIVAAAGDSKRLGRPKQLLSLGESTLIELVVDNFLKSNLREVIVILGHRYEEISSKLSAKPVRMVYNPAYSEGLSSSIKAGILAVNTDSSGVMIALGDQPLIGADIINLLIDTYQDGSKGIVRPAYRGKKGHPVIIDLKYKDEILNISGDIGCRDILLAHQDDVETVEVNSRVILLDIDTEEDYRAYFDSNLKLP